MLWLLKKIIERLKTLLVASAATDLEAEFLLRRTERKAELLGKAQEYEEQDLGDLADELREQALELSHETPLSRGLPTRVHWTTSEGANDEPPKLERAEQPQDLPHTAKSPQTTKPKSKRRSKAR